MDNDKAAAEEYGNGLEAVMGGGGSDERGGRQ